MDVSIRPLQAGDRPAVSGLLDQSVGAGFWGFDSPEDEIAVVAVDSRTGEIVGAALSRLERGSDPDAGRAFGTGDEAASDRAGDPGPGDVLHVRAVAVVADARRMGIARRLLLWSEEQAARAGAATAYLFAWLPDGQPEPAAVPFYLAAGYVPRPDIPDFYAAGSIASGAECPFCGAPPCRCAARPYVKRLAGG